ncbi:MAG: hypothetical protein KAG94_00265 [Clostridiales bacterium]|nr:hypothetical protein [Clostridiales bacterium]
MDFNHYIENMTFDNFSETNLLKKDYFDIIELCVNAYTYEEITSWLPKISGDEIDDLQSFSRITAALGVLLAEGRKKDYEDLWYQMMDACALSFYKERPYTVLDFAVKEFMFAYRAMKDHVPDKKLNIWKEYLSKIDPFKSYYCSVDNSNCAVYGNWGIYNLAGEFLRELEGMTDTLQYFDKHIPIQLQMFDQNGMYKDPHNPMLYDVASRSNLLLIIGNDYQGIYANELDNHLKKAGLYSLFMQSSAFEFPYGGRSNQYIFNETYVVSIYEYEAKRYLKEGNLVLAGMFKRAAHLSVLSIKRWLQATKYPRHIKNFFEKDSLYGTESYGYYRKYMMSIGSFIYIACQFCDDDIKEYPCPSETGGYILQTSSDFHKVFANCQGYSIEIDTKADFIYDSTGFGRFHKQGFPTELGLSTPLSATHRYETSKNLQNKNISYCGGSLKSFLCDFTDSLTSVVYNQQSDSNKVSFSIKYFDLAFTDFTSIEEHYQITNEGVTVTSRLVNPKTDHIYFMLPALSYNGKDTTIINHQTKQLTITLEDQSLIASTDGTIIKDDNLYGNRNGHYKLFYAMKKGNKITVNLQMR